MNPSREASNTPDSQDGNGETELPGMDTRTAIVSGKESTESSNPADATSTDVLPNELTLDLDVTFDVLKNHRRRIVLSYLTEHGGQATVSELAEHLAAIENNKPESHLSSQERKRVYIGLYQCHLPRMNDGGVIDFDKYRGTVEATPAVPALTDYLKDGEATDERRSDPPQRFSFVIVSGLLMYVFTGTMAMFPSWLNQFVLIGFLVTVACLALLQ